MLGITALVGDPLVSLKVGNGKSCILTSILKEEYDKGKTIFTNLNLTFGDNDRIYNIENFFDILKVKNAVVGIDELTAFLGTAYSSINTELKDDIIRFCGQQRKRGVPLYYTNQLFFNAPLFLRRMTTKIYLCYKLHKYPPPTLSNVFNNICMDDTCIKEHIYYAKNSNILSNSDEDFLILNPNKIYSLYDTYQIIEPMKLIKSKDGSVKYVKTV